MGCCQQRTASGERIFEIQVPNRNPGLESSPKQIRLTPLNLFIEGDNDLNDYCGDGYEQMESLPQFHKLQKKLSSRDQKPTMTSETVIIDLRRPSISSPSKTLQDKGSRNLNQKFIEML